MFVPILWAMMKEEWRIHTKTAKNQTFWFFPILIGIGTAVFSLCIPFALFIVAKQQLFQYLHFLFLFFGISIGAFGLFGKEIMNRRFGQVSLIAYSSRSLPVSEQKVFLAFFLKDILFYVFLWIAPIFVGFLVVTPFIGFSFSASLIACGTLVLSFLLGLSVVFFLSTIYAHSSKLLIIILVTVLALLVASTVFTELSVNFLLLPYTLYYSHSALTFGVIITLISVSSLLSVVFVKIDYPEKKKHYRNILSLWTRRFGFSTYSCYIAKDFIDLKRSEGGLGKVIFSFLLPILFTYMFLSIFLDIIPTVKIVMIFAVFLGIVSATIYNMITEFDSFNPYLFLPVKVSTILHSKIMSFLLVNVFSIAILGVVAVAMDQLLYFFPALLLFVSIALFTLAVTVYLTGLHPNFLLYDSKVFIPYAGMLCPTIFLLTLCAIVNPFTMVASPLLLPVAWMLLKKSFNKWDQWTPVNL